MATITLQYDGRDSLMKQLVEVILTAGATVVASTNISPLDKALEDVQLGKVTTICKPKNAKRK